MIWGTVLEASKEWNKLAHVLTTAALLAALDSISHALLAVAKIGDEGKRGRSCNQHGR